MIKCIKLLKITKSNKKRYGVMLCILIMYLSACSSTAKIQMVQPMSEEIDPKKSAYISVVSVDKKKEELAVMLQDALFSKFISRSIFKEVTANKNESVDYIVDVTISKGRKVSGAARVWLGVFAGANRIIADVTVKERLTDKVLTTFKVTGESALMPYSTQDGLNDAVREASNKIVDAMINMDN